MDPFKQFGNLSKPRKTNSSRSNNFIEALKDFSGSVKKQTKDATIGVASSVVSQLVGFGQPPMQPESGQISPDKPFNFAEFLKSREQQIRQQERLSYERKYREETLVFSRKQEETKLQIKAIQEEIKKLADSTQGLSIEVKKASFQAVVDPGTYHVNFFERLRRIIQFVRKQIAESCTWLETMNSRCKKKSYYWSNAKKSGTKFMLSQERYMATQAG